MLSEDKFGQIENEKNCNKQQNVVIIEFIYNMLQIDNPILKDNLRENLLGANSFYKSFAGKDNERFIVFLHDIDPNLNIEELERKLAEDRKNSVKNDTSNEQNLEIPDYVSENEDLIYKTPKLNNAKNDKSMIAYRRKAQNSRNPYPQIILNNEPDDLQNFSEVFF